MPCNSVRKSQNRHPVWLKSPAPFGGRECAGAGLRSGKPPAGRENFLAQISGWGSEGRARKFGRGVSWRSKPTRPEVTKRPNFPHKRTKRERQDQRQKSEKCAQIRRGATYAVRPLPWSDTPGCLFALLGFAPRHPPAGALRSGTPTRKGARPPPGPTPVWFRKLSAGRRLADPPRFLRPLLRRAPPCRGKPASRPGAPSFRLAVRRARRSRHRPP